MPVFELEDIKLACNFIKNDMQKITHWLPKFRAIYTFLSPRDQISFSNAP